MKKISLLLLTLCIVATFPCKSQAKPESVYSEWSLQCRGSEAYLYEDQGVLKFGKEAVNDSYLWICEATPNEEVKIRNKKTGNFLLMDHDGKVICRKTGNTDNKNLHWSYGGFGIRQMGNCGWYTISNATYGTDKYLVQTPQGLELEKLDRNTDFNSHWTLVREKGSRLPFAIYSDSVVDASFLGMRKAVANSPTEIVSDYHKAGDTWKLTRDISAFPQFTAEKNTMLSALYNLALEEMLLDIRTDSTFMAGKLWPGTWTRDVVYSIYFSFSWILPEISRKTLEKQTLKNPKEALQDTGSGGSWPISTDRVVWALAAWEYYLTTGDKQWLAEAYEGLSNTAMKDIHVAFDTHIGLFKGETCSMDWRTHTYPNWFANATIGESFSSGTNALHLFLYQFLVNAGKITGKSQDEINRWEHYHALVKKGLNERFWDEKKGLYSCYLYPQYMDYKATQRVGSMSNGLCALLGAASEEQTQRIIKNYPLYPYGAAVLYPTIPDDFSYHNKSIWAVWQTPYLYAAKKVGNMAAVEHIIQSQVRQGAMFLTHKENMTYDTGYDRNTALNSDRQLWSVASFVSIVYRMLFGMEMTETGMKFNPVVPGNLVQGKISLTGFHYRNSILNMNITENGNKIKSLKLNGKEQKLPFELPAGASGAFTIDIEMMTDNSSSQTIHLVEAGSGKCWSPVEPVLMKKDDQISWNPNKEYTYKLVGPGINKTIESPYNLKNDPAGFYSIYSIDKKGVESDLSNPVLNTSFIASYEAEEAVYQTVSGDTASGFSGKGYVIDLAKKPADIEFTLTVPETGNYAFQLTGSNGIAHHGTFCAIRSVFIDDIDSGTFILEATGKWNEWTGSNLLIINNLKKGKHTVKLKLNPENKGYDNNMSFNKENANDCYLDYLKVFKVK